MQAPIAARKKVRVLFPTSWDLKELGCGGGRGRYEVELSRPFDQECPWDFDVLSFIDREVAASRGADGVFSSSDYPGAIAAGAVSERLGVPGPPARAVLRASHKYYSRIAQREAVPEATPGFQLVDPKLPRGGLRELRFPCFIKPVKGAFSVMSRRLDSWNDLDEFLAKPALAEFLTHYVFLFDQLVRGLTDFEIDGGYLLVEDLLRGRQVTVEGFVTEEAVTVLGIVDSVQHPGTRSFVRFDYPSTLSRRVQSRMEEVAAAAIRALGLRRTLFNVEMMYDQRRDRVFIVEVNPRMCGQFADLYEKVDGRSGYDVALALAAFEAPPPKGEGPFRVASSFPLRIFSPARLSEAPSEERIAEVERQFPGTRVWPEARAGDRLDDFERLEDGRSFRYAVVNLGAPNRDALFLRFEEVRRALGYRFEEI